MNVFSLTVETNFTDDGNPYSMRCLDLLLEILKRCDYRKPIDTKRIFYELTSATYVFPVALSLDTFDMFVDLYSYQEDFVTIMLTPHDFDFPECLHFNDCVDDDVDINAYATFGVYLGREPSELCL